MTPKLFMETTQISPEKTAIEIQTFLARAGAKQVVSTYNAQREIDGIYFLLAVRGNEFPFKMPVRVDPIFKIINGRRKLWTRNQSDNIATDRQTAKRVAWRQLYRWIQAQVAIIDTGMVAADEAFMPYLQVGTGETLYERAMGTGFQALLPAKVD